jgi:hypothetical protein
MRSASCTFASARVVVDDAAAGSDGNLSEVLENCHCVLQGSGDFIHITTRQGHVYETALPCRALNIYALNGGLLIERMPFVEEHVTAGACTRDSLLRCCAAGVWRRRAGSEYPDCIVACVSAAPGAASGAPLGDVPKLPSLFTLRHPLDEPKPVCLAPVSFSAFDTSSQGAAGSAAPPLYFQDSAERVVSCLADRSVLVTFNAVSQRHSLWHIRDDGLQQHIDAHASVRQWLCWVCVCVGRVTLSRVADILSVAGAAGSAARCVYRLHMDRHGATTRRRASRVCVRADAAPARDRQQPGYSAWRFLVAARHRC